MSSVTQTDMWEVPGSGIIPIVLISLGQAQCNLALKTKLPCKMRTEVPTVTNSRFEMSVVVFEVTRSKINVTLALSI